MRQWLLAFSKEMCGVLEKQKNSELIFSEDRDLAVSL